MKLFKDNLIEYEKSMSLASIDIAELADMPLDVITGMENGRTNVKDISTFCIRLGIAYSSVFSDDGFKQVSVLDQYDAYPIAFKRIITKHLWKKVSKILGGDGITVFHYAVAGRFKSGYAGMTRENIQTLEESVKGMISSDDFYTILSEIAYSKLANYNLEVIKDHYQLSYPDIGKAIGVSASTVSNWGGKWCVPIPTVHLDKIVDSVDGISLERFLTVPLKDTDFKGRCCHIARHPAKKGRPKLEFPDPPSDDITLEEIGPKETEVEIKEPESEVEVIEQAPEVIHRPNLSIDNNRAMKLYDLLSQEDKDVVNARIAELFFK